MSKLDELRAKLLAKDNTKTNFQSDNAVYPFWNIPESSDVQQQPAVIRFLPDGNTNNDFFWQEMQKIRLTFPSIIGQPNATGRDVQVQVPCMEMWDGTCPILTEIRPWFKDASLEDMARSYWKKRSYVFQGIVRTNPLDEQDVPENPIRRFIINTSIFNSIKAGLLDPDLDEMPTHYDAGTDYRIIRTKKSNYSNYDQSGYSRKSTSLTPEEREAIDTHGLSDLSSFMPKKPDDESLQAISEMFEASVNGEPYDPQRWAKFYRPAGVAYSGNDSNTTSTTVPKDISPATTTPVTEPVAAPVETVAAPVETVAAPAAGGKSPSAILAEIKARTQNS